MLAASVHKSVTDLTRRRACTSFTVATLALAVASISFLAIPTLIDRAMQEEVRAVWLADATVTMRPLELTDAQLADLLLTPERGGGRRRACGSIALGAWASGGAGARHRRPRLRGQKVDLVRLDSGKFPARARC